VLKPIFLSRQNFRRKIDCHKEDNAKKTTQRRGFVKEEEEEDNK